VSSRKNPDLYRGVSVSGAEPPMEIDNANDIDQFFAHIQRTWEKLGSAEPFWSVITAEKFTPVSTEDRPLAEMAI
jgi:hypothetical protein